jgi:hypothetical protein
MFYDTIENNKNYTIRKGTSLIEGIRMRGTALRCVAQNVADIMWNKNKVCNHTSVQMAGGDSIHNKIIRLERNHNVMMAALIFRAHSAHVIERCFDVRDSNTVKRQKGRGRVLMEVVKDI